MDDRALRVAAIAVAASVLLAGVNAVAVVAAVPMPRAGGWLRALDLAFDAMETLGLGLVLAVVAAAVVRFVRLAPWATWIGGVASLAFVAWISNEEFLARIASQLFQGRFEGAIFALYVGVIAAGSWDAIRTAASAAERGWLAALPVGVAIVGLALDNVFLRDDYFSVHGLAAVIAALVGGAGLGPVALRSGRRLWRGAGGRGLLCAIGAGAVVGLAWAPSNAVRLELFRPPCAVAPWVLARLVWRAPGPAEAVAVPASPWNEDRSKAPDRPASHALQGGAPPAPVVVLVTIDALRGDVIDDPSNDAALPTFARLKREGVFFRHASAPGTQTPVSLGALFSGVYFSEQRWAPFGLGSTRYLYPAEDDGVRFPQLLPASASFGGLAFLRNAFGVLRGFQEETVVVEGRRHAEAKELIDPLLRRLAASPRGPLFLYAHLMEPHWPYDRGRKDGTEFERYVSEIAVADAAVGSVLAALERRADTDWVLLVSADHGEAFGEHETTGHAKTLYEELLHVPLLARGPRFPPRVVEQRVGLIDVGPTILDLFGRATPATFEGESLLPILEGGSRDFTRPLLAECRLRRAITMPDGFKVIDDPRRKTVEAYDLSADPGEQLNLHDAERARTDAVHAELRAFFAAHTRHDDGYEIPYEP